MCFTNCLQNISFCKKVIVFFGEGKKTSKLNKQTYKMPSIFYRTFLRLSGANVY